MKDPLILTRVLERLEQAKAKAAARGKRWNSSQTTKMAILFVAKMEWNGTTFIIDKDDFSLIIANLKNVKLVH